MTYPHTRRACLIVFAVAASFASFQRPTFAAIEEPVGLPSLSEPAISPDGSEIAFVSASEIWTVKSDGGEARILIAGTGTESHPLYSPDGKKLAFVSTRSGNGDIYVMTFSTGEVRRITYDDTQDHLDAWSADGTWLYFSTTAHDLGGMNNDVYRVRADGGTPMPVVAESYSNEFGGIPSPDGKSIAYVAGGMALRDWWRHGHSHWDSTRLWLMRGGIDDDKPSFSALTGDGEKVLWPMWQPDGKRLFYVCDRDGTENIWSITAQNSAATSSANDKRITDFSNGRVLWPDISRDGRTIVFERDFNIWKLDTKTGKSAALDITLRGAPATPGVQHLTYVGGFRDLALSPDGKKVAFVAHGEVFAASAQGGGTAIRVTHTVAGEAQLTWAPDSHRLAYVCDRGDGQNVFVYDFSSGNETAITHGDSNNSRPSFSPDGKSIAFLRDGRELIVADLAAHAERIVARGLSTPLPPFDDAFSPFVWSPRGKWLAYISNGTRGFDNVFVVNASAGSPGAGTASESEPKQVTFFANTGSNSVSWSPDGRFLLFSTGQRTEDFQIARIDMIPRPPNFAEDQFRGLFQEGERTFRPGGPRELPRPERPTERNPERPTEPAPTSLPAEGPAELFNPSSRPSRLQRPSDPSERLALEGAWQRVSLLPVGIDIDYQTVAPDNKWVVLVGNASGRQNLYAYPLEGGGGEQGVLKQITSTSGPKNCLQFAPDGREAYYLDGGAIRIATVSTGAVRDLNVRAETEVDFAVERMEVGREAWKALSLNFFDPKFNGVDWQRIRETYFPRFAGARTPDELRRLMGLMVGELNASHLGIHGSDRSSRSVGRLGCGFERAAYESRGELRVTDVIPYGPAAVAGLKNGDYLLSVDGQTVDRATNLDALLDRKIGKRVAIVRAEKADGKGKSEVAVLAVDASTDRTLAYRAWIEDNRRYVETASKGRLGYVHIADMGRAALARLTQDLDARAFSGDGVVIDVRGNTGGFVSPYVLDVFARRGFLTMTRRGSEPTPGRPFVGQRALDLPTVLITNRGSVSDAEIFTEGYRALGLGKVVGEPTAGGVIFTSDISLIDGTVCRIPSSKVTARDGSSLEAKPRAVDVPAVRQMGETAGEKDSQLDAAVLTLLKQIDG